MVAAEPWDTTPAAAPSRPLKVGVLVDLALTANAGGHVKCWQRLAEAAVDLPGELDLTLHFSGPEPQIIPLSPSVRYRLLPPVFSTARLVRELPDDTDLARWHPALARELGAYDVLHTTDAYFCYAHTATRFARRHAVPVVSSIHTNTPEYARITTRKQLERLLGSIAARIANDLLKMPEWVRAALERRLSRHLDEVTAALVRSGDALNVFDRSRHRGRSLRRGVNRALFTPKHRDRAWFARRFDLQPERLILMYAGKLNAGKNVPLLIPIIGGLRRAGIDAQLLCAGDGSERAALETALGDALVCTDAIEQEELARAYASADLFLFPSVIDEFGNAVVEALACGLPTLLAAGSGAANCMADCTGLQVLPGDDPAPWVVAIIGLARCPQRLAALATAARAYVEAHVPDWGEVLREDLLPLWQMAAAQRPR
jgi:glycosyltransferase involved in cell wall biosynthesis